MKTVNFSELNNRLGYVNFSMEMQKPINFGLLGGLEGSKTTPESNQFLLNVWNDIQKVGDKEALTTLDGIAKASYNGNQLAQGTYEAAKNLATKYADGEKGAVSLFGKLINAGTEKGLTLHQIMQVFPAGGIVAGAGAAAVAALAIRKLIRRITAKSRLNKGLPPRNNAEAKEMAAVNNKLINKQRKAQEKFNKDIAKMNNAKDLLSAKTYGRIPGQAAEVSKIA